MSDFQIETRRRSRSKTPFLRSSCDHESCEHAGEEGHVHHHKKKATTAPNVQTITEETVEVTSSSSSAPSAKLTQSKSSQQKIKTSDYSSEDTSPENKKMQQQKQSSSSTTMTTSSSTIITKTTKKLGSLQATSTPKALRTNNIQDSFVAQFASGGGGGGIGRAVESRRRKEVTQNELNTEFERTQRDIAANNSKNRSFSRFLGSSYTGEQSSTYNTDLSDHLAYKEYKNAGEYWKTTPKTDYTYSELSPHRRVLAPGIIAMPNMSRKSLENHHERINYMIERDPAQEEYIRRRYETSKYAQNRRATEKLVYDSGDEIDYSQYSKQKNYYNGGKYTQLEQASWFMRIITTIVSTTTSIWTTLTGNAADDYNSAMYRTKLAQEERGFFGSIAHGISSTFVGLFRYIYLFMSSIFSLDIWLLQSSNAENKSKKRFLLFLLMLLPLLLLGGLYYYLHPNEPFPPKSFSELTFTLPSLPKIDISEYMPNQESYDALKSQANNRFEDFRAWSDDYLLYLKTLSQNVANEGRKLFRREEYFERV